MTSPELRPKAGIGEHQSVFHIDTGGAGPGDGNDVGLDGAAGRQREGRVLPEGRTDPFVEVEVMSRVDAERIEGVVAGFLGPCPDLAGGHADSEGSVPGTNDGEIIVDDLPERTAGPAGEGIGS